jgi:hypothetical protein
MSVGAAAVVEVSRLDLVVSRWRAPVRAYFFNPRWSVDLEVGYTYIPTSDIVTHEINAALSAVYHYGGLIERRRARRDKAL